MGKHAHRWANRIMTDEFDHDPGYHPDHRATTRAEQFAAICQSPTALDQLWDHLPERLSTRASVVNGYHDSEQQYGAWVA